MSPVSIRTLPDAFDLVWPITHMHLQWHRVMTLLVLYLQLVMTGQLYMVIC